MNIFIVVETTFFTDYLAGETKEYKNIVCVYSQKKDAEAYVDAAKDYQYDPNRTEYEIIETYVRTS